MGKTTRWLRSLFGSKKSSSKSGSRRQTPENRSSYPNPSDEQHAIAVAAATAAVAEAALAAAHAAAEVVRLTSGGGSRAYYPRERRREAAAVKIQSAFRAYLARRALRALKGLVKLQALVRGHIVRKQSADMLRRMQAMARLQAQACAHRAHSSSASPHSSLKSFRSHHHPRSNSMSNIKGQERHHHSGPYWIESWMEDTSWTSKSDKILEVDTWKPRKITTPTKTNKSRLTDEVSRLDSSWATEKASRSAENKRGSYSGKTRSGHKRSPFSMGHSGEYPQSLFGEYPSHPNYMANTESSQARVRSLSAPRQRLAFERLGTTRRHWDYSDTRSEMGFRR